MNYLLLIHQGTTPTPDDPQAWASLSGDEQKAVFADYQAINQTPGVTPGQRMQPPEMATTVRVQDGKAITTDGPFVEMKEALGGWFRGRCVRVTCQCPLARGLARRLGCRWCSGCPGTARATPRPRQRRHSGRRTRPARRK